MSEGPSISEADLEKALKDAGMTEKEFSNNIPIQPAKPQFSKKNEQKYKELDNESDKKAPILDQEEIDRLLAEFSKED